MSKSLCEIYRWGALWQGHGDVRDHLLCENLLPVLFRTKKESKAWIDKKYGYVKTRKDLRAAPHSWRIPKPIKIKVQYLRTFKEENR